MFQKSVGIKKFPSNHTTRGVLNPYNLETGGGTSIMPLPPPMNMMQLGDPTSHLLYGRNYMMSSTGSSSSLNPPLNLSTMQPHFNFPVTAGGGFTISGLNLNLGGGGATSSQPFFRPMQPQEHSVNVVSSNMVTASLAGENNVGVEVGTYGAEMNNANLHTQSNIKYMGMDHCVDFDTYWPSY